ncbi:hypothetical protein [Arthrobacter glacialis]|uniref:Uncharacterized protein n=1 Tax=Arthrobacter glacialis TaxID=1664 RepID=A0A2S3ZWN5_ARTGL|nr:hypothetical protein [Arthrobacter glacialis]POH58841.1 hypothetical protein CVS28_08980 [Arthrobacter glacialis]POH73638.1 hypothetical protein CVS27_09735 [Arthrobacter glacialis]
MPTDATFYAPVGYSPWWPLAGAAILILCLGWFAWVWNSTRAGAQAGVPDFVAPRNPNSVRAKYWALISSIEENHDAGTLSARAAHLELSMAVRTFVHEMTGLKTQRMTLAQLREHQLPLVADAVELYYPGEFAAHSEHLTVAGSAASARNVVGSWR